MKTLLLFCLTTLTVGFRIFSEDAQGMCVEVDDADHYLCKQHMTSKGPIWLPANTTEMDLWHMDHDVQMVLLSSDSGKCFMALLHVLCGAQFAPCELGAEPVPTGLCKTACETYSNCDPYGGDGYLSELCESSFVVNNTGNDEILCGESASLVPILALVAALAA